MTGNNTSLWFNLKELTKGRNRISRFLRDGAIAFIIGAIFSLIALVPEDWVSSVQKFCIGVILLLVASVTIVGKAFYEDLSMYLQIRSEIKEYYGLMPHIVRLSEYRKIYYIEPNGDAKVVHRIVMKNLSPETLNSFAIPTFFDIYEEYEEEGKLLEVEKVMIGTREMTSADERCYEKDGIIQLASGGRQERGFYKIPFVDVGGLKTQKEVEIEVHAKTVGVFKKMEEGEYVALDIYHPTDMFELIVYPPKTYEISLNPTETFPKSVKIYDWASKVIDHTEIAIVPEPVVIENRIEWKGESPKLSYHYRLFFKTHKTT